MRTLRKILVVLITFSALLWAWFKSYTGPFKPVSWPHELVNVEPSRLKTHPKGAAACAGFSGECSFPAERLKLRVSFDGLSWNKPYYAFLTLWGGGNRLRWERTYYGRRNLRIVDKGGRVIAHYTQLIWNSSAYGDLNSLITFDPSRRIVFVAYGAYGFTGTLDLGYAHAYSDLI